jgi:hypothetical protein
MDAALTSGCVWLTRHPRLTCALICAGWLVVAALDMPR